MLYKEVKIMTISQAIEKLESLKSKHGNVEVFFDCPKCNESFKPTKIVGLAIHLTDKKDATR